MDRVEIDDCLFKLSQVMDIYDKKLKPGALHIWIDIFSGHSKDDCIAALNELIKNSRYAPKPSDVIEILKRKAKQRGNIGKDDYCGQDATTKKALESDRQSPTLATRQISAAWIIYHKLLYGGNLGLPVKNEDCELTVEQALIIVNQQAAKYDQPEAIINEYKLTEYWNNDEVTF